MSEPWNNPPEDGSEQQQKMWASSPQRQPSGTSVQAEATSTSKDFSNCGESTTKLPPFKQFFKQKYLPNNLVTYPYSYSMLSEKNISDSENSEVIENSFYNPKQIETPLVECGSHSVYQVSPILTPNLISAELLAESHSVPQVSHFQKPTSPCVKFLTEGLLPQPEPTVKSCVRTQSHLVPGDELFMQRFPTQPQKNSLDGVAARQKIQPFEEPNPLPLARRRQKSKNLSTSQSFFSSFFYSKPFAILDSQKDDLAEHYGKTVTQFPGVEPSVHQHSTSPIQDKAATSFSQTGRLLNSENPSQIRSESSVQDSSAHLPANDILLGLFVVNEKEQILSQLPVEPHSSTSSKDMKLPGYGDALVALLSNPEISRLRTLSNSVPQDKNFSVSDSQCQGYLPNRSKFQQRNSDLIHCKKESRAKTETTVLQQLFSQNPSSSHQMSPSLLSTSMLQQRNAILSPTVIDLTGSDDKNLPVIDLTGSDDENLPEDLRDIDCQLFPAPSLTYLDISQDEFNRNAFDEIL